MLSSLNVPIVIILANIRWGGYKVLYLLTRDVLFTYFPTPISTMTISISTPSMTKIASAMEGIVEEINPKKIFHKPDEGAVYINVLTV